MMMSRATVLALVACVPALRAQAVQPPFNAVYSIGSIGPIPGLSGNYGAITFDRDDPSTLLCSQWNAVNVQNLYAIKVVRDSQGHVTGFTGTLAPRAQADRIDGGLDFHPSGVLFYTRYPNAVAGNEVGQFKPGSIVPDRVDAVLGPSYSGGLAIVPLGVAGAGRLKLLRWPGGQWTDAQLTPDGVGTFHIVGETQKAVLAGGPDAFAYVPRPAPLFTGGDVLVAEYTAGNLAAYAIDAQGDPIVATRKLFASGFTGAFSLTVDPVTLDMLHADWSAGAVHVIRGFGAACGQCAHYGAGLGGTGNQVPAIVWLGCPLVGQVTGVHVGNGLPSAPGAVAIGFTQLAFPFLGGTLLNEVSVAIPHTLSQAGRFALPLAVPPGVVPTTLYFQALYVDAGAPYGVAMTNGFTMPIR